MKLIILLNILFCWSTAFAMVDFYPHHLEFVEDGDHFVEVTNYDQKLSHSVTFSLMNIYPSSDGQYTFIDYKEGPHVERSLQPYMNVRTSEGELVLNGTIELLPGETKRLHFDINLPAHKNSGSFYNLLAMKIDGSEVVNSVAYVMYTAKASNVGVRFQRIKYVPFMKKGMNARRELQVTVSNRGTAYVDADIELFYRVMLANGEQFELKKEIGLPNYLLPSKNIRRSYNVEPHIKLIKKLYPEIAEQDGVIAVAARMIFKNPSFQGARYSRTLNTVIPLKSLD